MRPIIPNSIIRSATYWLRGFWGLPMKALRSPITTGPWSRKRVRASYKCFKRYRVEGRRYALITGVYFLSVTTLQLTMFSPWKRVASMLQPCG